MDRTLQPNIGVLVFVSFAVLILWATCFWLIASSRCLKNVTAIFLLAVCSMVGAVHHHLAWHSAPQNDIAQHLPQDQTLIKVRGTIEGMPTFIAPSPEPKPSWRSNSGSTRFVLKCDSIAFSTSRGVQYKPVAGLLRVYVANLQVSAGDRIEVLGKGNGIPRARNPGEREFGEYLKKLGIRGLLRVADRALIKTLEPSTNPLRDLQRTARTRCEQFLQGSLDAKTRPIAAALLLGDRSAIAPEVRALFVESGAMHLLAISGLHVGILTTFMMVVARLIGLNGRWSVVFVLAFLTAYLSIADLRPPMIRAFTLVAIWAAGQFLRRPSFSANSLAMAAIVVLAMNPSDLFDVGAQLSFLAVATIMWLTRMVRRRTQEPVGDITAVPNSSMDSGSAAGRARRQKESAERVLQSTWQRWLRSSLQHVKRAYLVSATVCVVSTPLVASAFNVISPVGIFINVLLIPIVGIGLCCGFLGMVLGACFAPLGLPFAIVFEWILKLVLWLVELASSLPLGHVYVPGPPMWWLVVMYGLIGAMMVIASFRRRTGWGWVGMIGWCLFGISLSMQPPEQQNLRCTFLSVKHGCSIMLEMPNGKVMVYDVGSLMNPRRASRVLEQALWARGHRRIDALVLSHADSDHYNGADSLLNQISVDRVLMTSHFIDDQQQGTIKISNRLTSLGIPIDVVTKGDRIDLDPVVSIQVLHPSTGHNMGNDNSVSIVLEISYGGRLILLTGDLEDPGLSELLSQDKRSIDVMLAPHHGSASSNTSELADWATPEFVVASTGRSPSQNIEDVYGSRTQVMWTSRDGAVTFEISSDGIIDSYVFLFADQHSLMNRSLTN